MTLTTADEHWSTIRAERVRLLGDLSTLTTDQWSDQTLCARWSVQDVVAHLTAGASLGRWAWLRSIVGARFRTDVHNERRLAAHRGPTPAQTLKGFQAVVDSRVAPTGDLWAWLGEVVVHGADIREPLGISTVPDVDAVVTVAEGFVRRDFAVSSRSTAKGLCLVATDSAFRAGDGPVVEGVTLDLVLAMAGRPAALPRLRGEGVPVLAERIAT